MALMYGEGLLHVNVVTALCTVGDRVGLARSKRMNDVRCAGEHPARDPLKISQTLIKIGCYCKQIIEFITLYGLLPV